MRFLGIGSLNPKELERLFLHLKSDSHLPKKLFCLAQWKPFKNNEKCFLLHLKSPFRSQDI